MVLYEFFNTTNQTSPYFERHMSFVTDELTPSCAKVEELPYSVRCQFVKDTQECPDSGLVNYFAMYYCMINPQNTFTAILCIIMMIAWCLFLFLILGTTADRFFCTSMRVIAAMMRMNESIAGVTLIALGNSAPDLFTGIASLSEPSRFLYSDVYSSGFFVAFLVTAVIILVVPFKVPETYLRDLMFYTLATVYINYSIVRTGPFLTLFQAISFGCIYILYIVVVVLDQVLLNHQTKVLLETTFEDIQQQAVAKMRISQLREDASLLLSDTRRKSKYLFTSMTSLHIEPDKKPITLLSQFVDSIWPIRRNEWKEASLLARIFSVIHTPVVVVLNIFIPLVDYDEELNGWSRLLNCLQIVISSFVLAIRHAGLIWMYGFPFALLIIVILTPPSIFIFVKTKTDVAPRFGGLFVFLSAFCAVSVISWIAEELVNVLHLVGITTHLSSKYIGVTLLAFGNSVGDLISNLALARQGFYKMGFSACMGGPLLISTANMCMQFVYKAVWVDPEDIKSRTAVVGTMGGTCAVFLIPGLVGLIFAVGMANFVMRRSIAIYMLLVYSLFLIYATLCEFQVVHFFASDHRYDL